MVLQIELARSGRSQCKICRSAIGHNEPRVGVERDDEVCAAPKVHYDER
jgi:hypothetical protein